jgi:Ca-activated chloride channel family protein
LSLHGLSFADPYFQLGLAAVPLLFAFAAAVRRRRARDVVTFTNLETLAPVAARRGAGWRRIVPLLLLALALSACVVALARPHVARTVSDDGAMIILLADVSGSMRATDVRPARIYAAVKAMHGFVDALPSRDRVGLVSFSDDVEVLQAPTTDHASVHSELDVLSPQGGTALGTAIESSVRMLVSSLTGAGIHRSPDGYLPGVIVLESDGAQDRGTVSPFASAQFAKAAGVRIYGVSLGTRRGFVTQGSGLLSRSVRAVPSPGTVAMLARETGGKAYDAADADRLDAIFRELGSTVGRRREQVDLAPWLELAAAALLVAGVLVARWWRAGFP